MDKKEINDEDTMYFGDESSKDYENEQKVYSEEDMYEEAKPLVTINSVEYDEGDYACDYSGDEEDIESDHKRHNYIIWAYILILVIIVIIIGVAIAKM